MRTFDRFLRTAAPILVALPLSLSGSVGLAYDPSDPEARRPRPFGSDPTLGTGIPPSRPSAVRESQETPPVPQSPQSEETRLTKNWGGPRKDLSALGIDLALIYKGEVSRNFAGGVSQDTVYLDNIDFRLSVDGERILGWKGGTAFLYLLSNQGGRPSLSAGDAQVTSNIETVAPAFKVYEAWIQQLLLDERASLLVGLHDLNSEFYVTNASGLFLNSSFGVGTELAQTGVNGPSIFPTTSPALRVRVESTSSFYLQTAAFGARAGDPEQPHGTQVKMSAREGFLLITEAGHGHGSASALEGGYGKLGLGAWAYTRTFDHQIEDKEDTSRGAYLLFEQSLAGTAIAFARYGVASSEVNRFSSCLGFGTTVVGMLPGRPEDQLGLGATIAWNGDEYTASMESAGAAVTSSETAIELVYRIEALPGVALQPDVQAVIHPDTNPELKTAWIGAMRFELNF